AQYLGYHLEMPVTTKSPYLAISAKLDFWRAFTGRGQRRRRLTAELSLPTTLLRAATPITMHEVSQSLAQGMSS
ncbi:MAG: hypothetical protein ACRENG_21980, partial [bacterium]